MQTEIVNNINELRKKIDATCMLGNIDPNNLTLIAVSKKKSHELINIALENGHGLVYNDASGGWVNSNIGGGLADGVDSITSSISSDNLFMAVDQVRFSFT